MVSMRIVRTRKLNIAAVESFQSAEGGIFIGASEWMEGGISSGGDIFRESEGNPKLKNRGKRVEWDAPVTCAAQSMWEGEGESFCLH